MSSEKKSLKIINGQVVTPNGILKNATIIVKEGIIDSISEGDADVPGAVEIDAKGNFVGPGLIDIQINGYNSVSFSLEGA